MRRIASIAASLPLVLLLCAVVTAQTRGTGRLAGRIVDPDGKPIEGVQVKATKAGDAAAAFEARTNKKGEWAIGGMAGGQWNLDFTRDGFETKSISIGVSEVSRIPPIEFSMVRVKPVVDPNAEIKEDLLKAAGMMQKNDFAGARQIYQALLAKYPEAHQLHPLIARTYAGEKQPEKAVSHLRLALEKDPESVEVKLLLGSVLVETGKGDEGRAMLAAVDVERVKDPLAFINAGIDLLNGGKPADAKTFFDKVVTRFPQEADGYYYRGLANLQLAQNAEAKADLQKFVAIAPKDSPQLSHATKILEQLK